MTSTSCKEVAADLLARCIAGEAPAQLPSCLLEEQCAAALFGIWVEGLADRFEPALCDVYTRLFSQALHQDNIRYERVRKPRKVSGEPKRVFVLSRVTLGADVAVTSVLLSAAKCRFPNAEICFVGPAKNQELFAGDSRIQPVVMDYRRGSLSERLAAADGIREIASDPSSIVIDPDSRYTQLGLVPVCPEENYYFFESRAYGGTTHRSLPELTAQWAEETLGVSGAKPYLALAGARAHARPTITISLGVGENPVKRIPDPFEAELLELLGSTGMDLVIDKGAGGPEAERVERALSESGVTAQVWDGSFAGFAERIAASQLYVGYDSAGQHVAAACGVPLISIFAGFPVERMFYRWCPVGVHCHVIRVDEPDPRATLAHIKERLSPILGL